METHNKGRHATRKAMPLFFWPLLLLFLNVNSVLANSAIDYPEATKDSLSIVASLLGSFINNDNDNVIVISQGQPRNSLGEWAEKLILVFPRLERALIIVTIINIVVIIFAALFYGVKLRSIQLISSPMGNIKLKSQAKNDFLNNLHNET
jgi:hypothetical protein